MFYEKVLKLVGNFVASILIANLLGPKDYGTYAFVLSFVYIFLPIIDFGMTEFIIKDLTNKSQTSEILIKSLKYRFITSLLMIVTTLLSFKFIFPEKNELTSYIVIFSVSFIFRSLDVIYHFFQSQLKNYIIAKTHNLIFLVLFFAKIIAVYLSGNILTFLLISAFENILQGFLYFYALKRDQFKFTFSKTKYQIKPYLKPATPILISTLLGTLYLKLDHVFIQKFLTATDLGAYSLASRFINVTVFIPETIAILGFPLLVKNFTKETIQRYLSIGMLAGLITTILISTILPLCLGLFLKSSFSDSLVLLRYLSILIIPMFFNLINVRLLMLANNFEIIFIQNTIIFFSNVVLNFLLISHFKLYGVIAATLLSYLIGFIIISLISQDYRFYVKSYLFPKLSNLLYK
tara:strand:- start:28151 stop:29368 length:1218 start_codon:yes stop_codon:yes gene_type:complete